MIVKNKRNGQQFETTEEEFQRLVTDQGNAYLYEVVSSDAPLEVKTMREMKLKNRTEAGQVTEVTLPEKKAKGKN